METQDASAGSGYKNFRTDPIVEKKFIKYLVYLLKGLPSVVAVDITFASDLEAMAAEHEKSSK